jgi:hypothetical protein
MERSHAHRAARLYQLDRLSQTTADAKTPDRKSLLDARSRKATPLLLLNRVAGSPPSPVGHADGEGSVERAHARPAPGLYYLDRLCQTTPGTPTPDRESLRNACGRKAQEEETEIVSDVSSLYFGASLNEQNKSQRRFLF